MDFLAHVGNFFKKVLGIAVTVAHDTEPLVDAALLTVGLGGLIPLYNSTVGLAFGAEIMALNAGAGPAKLAQLMVSLEPQVAAWASANGIVWDQAGIQKWASAIVDTIKLIPAPTVAPKP